MLSQHLLYAYSDPTQFGNSFSRYHINWAYTGGSYEYVKSYYMLKLYLLGAKLQYFQILFAFYPPTYMNSA